MSEQRDVSYGELAALEDLFYDKVREQGIEFPDEDIENECLMDFQQQYIDGNDEAEIIICW